MGMFSFDISAIDVVLAIAVLVLGILFLSQRKNNTASVHEAETPLEGSKQEASRRTSNDSEKCPHFFGYLRNHPKTEPIPDECFGCYEQLRCLFQNESEESHREHVTA
jgi:hypothetical protein